MGVDIDVHLKKIDSSDIKKIERQLESIGDDIDINFDLDKILDGDFDELELKLDEDNLKSQIQRAMHKVKADMEAGVFEPFAGGGEGERGLSSPAVRQRAKMISELQAVNRKLAGNNLGQNISITENLPGWKKSNKPSSINYDDSVADFDLSGSTIELTDSEKLFPDGIFSEFETPLEDMNFLRTPRGMKFDGKRLSEMLGAGGGPAPGVPRRVQDLMDQPEGGLERASRSALVSASRNNGSIPDIDSNKVRFKRAKKQLQALDVVGDKLVSTFKRLQPSFRKVYAITATLLPAIAGLAVQLGAVATSFLALGAVGATIGLLGMLGGEANTLEGSMKQAEDRMESFKESLFQAIQPIADLFGPIVDRFLGAVVNKVRGLTDELAALRGYSGIFFEGLDAGAALLEGLLQSMVNLRPVIEQVVSQFSGLTAGGFVQFFRNVIIEGAKSSDTLAKIAGMLFQVGRLVYFALKAVVRFVGVLSTFTPIIRLVADILGNRWVQALLIIIASIASLVGIIIAASKAMTLMIGAILALNGQLVLQGGLLSYLSSLWAGSWISSAIAGIYGMVQAAWALNGALGVAAKLATVLMGVLTLGAGLAIAAGAIGTLQDTLSPDVPSTGGGGIAAGSGGETYNDVTMNFQGDMDSTSRQRMVDVTEGVMYEDDLSSGQFGSNGL